jgi:ABC-2 type transport system permease protein
MTTQTGPRTATLVAPGDGSAADRSGVAARAEPGFAATLRAEWVKLTSVRSTTWTLVSLFVVGAGLTVLICALNAEWLASPEADESPGSFLTWGMLIAQLTAVVLGTLAVTTEYGTGMVRTTFAAVPSRGQVLAAKSLLVATALFAVGTATALVGYLGGNWFLDREGVGMALEGDVLRAMYGSGLYLAGLGLFSVAVGFLLRHTAAAVSVVLGLVFVVGNMAYLLPGAWGEWVANLMPGNAGGTIATPVSFNPDALGAWTGYAAFMAETLALLALAYLVLRRRDA